MASDRPLRLPERHRAEDQTPLLRTHTHTRNAANVSDSAQPKRKRASKPKVRTGCITCKIRRVKCDETKPNCNRCTSTGRKCDGYEFTKEDQPSTSKALAVPPAKAQTSQSQLILPHSMSVSFLGNEKERRAFHHFQIRTVRALAGSSEPEFWQNLVLKVGQQEPAIRTAIVALSTLHEDYLKRRGKYSQDMVHDPSHRVALSLYGKALGQVNQRLSQPSQTSVKVALIASILFTCFEVLQRNNMRAMTHFQAGLKQVAHELGRSLSHQKTASESSSAVTEFRATPKNEPSTIFGGALAAIPEDEFDVLSRVFARYDVQACTFSKPRAEAIAIGVTPQPPSFRTLDEVRIHLDNLIISVYQVINPDLSMYRYWKTEFIPIEWRTQCYRDICMFESWLSAIEHFFHSNNPSTPTSTCTRAAITLTLPPQERKTLLGLRMQVKVDLIMLKTCLDSAPETSFDAFLLEFNDIVTRTEELADSLALPEAAPLEAGSADFTMELGILHPLFFVATKCRDWGVRRRAIAALRRGGREGIWEGPIVAIIADRVREIEEEGLEWGTVVPEFKRVHDVKKDVDYERRNAMMECRRSLDLVDWKVWEVVRESIRF